MLSKNSRLKKANVKYISIQLSYEKQEKGC